MTELPVYAALATVAAITTAVAYAGLAQAAADYVKARDCKDQGLSASNPVHCRTIAARGVTTSFLLSLPLSLLNLAVVTAWVVSAWELGNRWYLAVPVVAVVALAVIALVGTLVYGKKLIGLARR